MLISMFAGCGQVNTGEAGFFTRWGEISSREALSDGLHFYEPIGTDLITYNIKNQTILFKTEAFTKDLQALQLQMGVTFNLERNKVIDLHAKVGKNYSDVLINPSVLNAAKDVLGKMEASEIVGKREHATVAIKDTITKVLQPYGINIVLVNIIDIDYSNAYEQAVEAKQVAQQAAQKEKNETLRIKEQAEQEYVKAQAEARIKVAIAEAESKAILMKAESEAKANLVKAESEAKAIEMKNKSLASSRSVIEYTIANQWDGKLPTQMFGNSPIPFLNINKNEVK